MHLHVHRFSDRAALHAECGDRPNNCMKTVDTGLLGLGTRRYVANVNCCPKPPNDVRRTIAHEITHALADCAGVYDALHVNPPRLDGSGEQWLLWNKGTTPGFEQKAFELTP